MTRAGSLLALAAYVLIPLPPLQLVALGAAAWLAARSCTRGAYLLALAGLAAGVYLAAFLANPVSLPLAARFGGAPALYRAGLVLAGALWLWAALAPVRPPGLRRRLPGGRLLLVWSALFLVAWLPGWSAPLAYGGDEGYHAFSVSLARLQLAALLQRPAVILLAAWLAAGIALAHRAARARSFAAWSCCGLLLAACLVPGAYPAELLAHPVAQERTYRFPAAQPWVSAALGVATLAHWGGQPPFGNELLRLLPLFALYGAGLFLGADRRLRGVSPVLAAAGILALLGVPTLLYHGSLLYLDLPLVALALVVAADLQRLLHLPAERLARRPSWWALILLGLTKETALPILLLVLALRAALRRTIAGELRLAVALLMPLVLYLAIRHAFHSRPYAGQYVNLLRPEIWARQACALAQQCGGLLPLALAGAMIGWRAGRRAAVLGSAAWIVGLACFLLAEAEQYVGLARLNLLLLPPLLALGWDALCPLMARRSAAGAAVVALLLASNLLLSPIDWQGRRADWGGSGERWYDYEQALRDVRAADPRARVLLGNMRYEYAVGLLLGQLDWRPARIADARPFPVRSPKENLRRTLTHARREGFDTVIYRQGDGREEIPRCSGFRLVARYPSRVGGLLLFRP